MLSADEHVRLSRVADAFGDGNLQKADGIWGSLIRDIVTRGGPLPNFDQMMFMVDRKAFLEEDEKLPDPADRLRFAAERLRVIREELAILDNRNQESSTQDEAERLAEERKTRERDEAIAEDALDSAKLEYEYAMLLLQDALRRIQESYERMEAVVRKLTS